MNLAIRTASAAALTAFISASAVGGLIYGSLTGDATGKVIVSALALGFFSAAAVFAWVWALVKVRFPSRRPVIGALRGAAIGTGTLLFVATVHAALNPGAAGVLGSILGQVFFSLLLFGWFAAGLGGICGKYIEHRFFGDGGI